MEVCSRSWQEAHVKVICQYGLFVFFGGDRGNVVWVSVIRLTMTELNQLEQGSEGLKPATV